MTLAQQLREMMAQPNGLAFVQKYMREAMNDPSTRHEIAEVRDFRTLPQTNEKPNTSE